MDVARTPKRQSGAQHPMASPSHPHTCQHLDALHQIRRSLSRSPSKPARFRLRSSRNAFVASATPPPSAPISPLALSRAFSPKPGRDASPTSSYPVPSLSCTPPAVTAARNGDNAHAFTHHHLTNSASSVNTGKRRFLSRRPAPFRARTRTSPTSRRVLGDANANTTPTAGRHSSGQENAAGADAKAGLMRRSLDDQPIKFEYARSRMDPPSLQDTPVKSSPLKRSDGIMNLDQASLGSPVAKRRSLHGASLGSGCDAEIFDSGPARPVADISREPDPHHFAFTSAAATKSPLWKASSLRKSTLSQRHGNAATRPKDHEFALPLQPASKARPRMSLDGSFSPAPPQQPNRRLSAFEPGGSGFQPCALQQPHPLSKALTPSSSASSIAGESPTHMPPPLTAVQRPHGLARSLPIGIARPAAPQPEADAFATPAAYKMAKPLPAAFMSTGLISKRNRNVDEMPASAVMPDTPSKRSSFPPVTASPTFSRGMFGKASQPRPEFGTPSTPFTAQKTVSGSLGRGANIFGTMGGLPRRGSFTSITSLDGDDVSYSPPSFTGDSQSGDDVMPPTPTKQHGSSRRSKENSLRSSLFGRRTSLAANTFEPPTAAEESQVEVPSVIETPQSVAAVHVSSRASLRTPHESFAPPDPSKLSISGNATRHESPPLDAGMRLSFPPATPTTPRDNGVHFHQHGSNVVTGVMKNDVDTALTGRFHSVALFGNGEFSQVYRVAKPYGRAFRSNALPHSGVWAVKKTKRPYTGVRDRLNKMRELGILQALRNQEHIVSAVDSWEARGHLYIQTEFCENGNLKDFLTQTGYKGRLDDFRIWKILLELSLGIKYIHDSSFIHLDLKPANIFIDWEGVLKIGDFGLASPWPTPHDIDGEGDREYIGPEVLSGRFDRPADIFALGMIMCEIAGNIVLPDNGTSWQRLRAGDMSDLPSLTWSSESSLVRDPAGDPISSDDATSYASNRSASSALLCRAPDTANTSVSGDDDFKFLQHVPPLPSSHRSEELVKPPNFMVDPSDSQALDKMVQWMITPHPDERPVVDQVYCCGGVQWVERRRRAGATVFEGNWGPADDVLGGEAASEQQGGVGYEDVMDTSS